ncbi:MAG: VOC family protein [Treponema sp.]|jgi:lactoylglutathione lyase|nr:VOC family protein [Treponema sp.]
MVTGIAHNAVNVLNMDKMLDFYQNGLGLKKAFELHREDGSPWIIYLKIAPGAFVELFYDGVVDRDQNYAPSQIGFNHWCITYTKLQSPLARLTAGAYVKADTKPVPFHGDGLNLWIDDPEGNGVEIRQLKGEAAYGGRDEILGIDHAAFVVSDINKALDFYRDKLGMKELPPIEKDGKPWISCLDAGNGQVWELMRGGTQVRANTWQSYGSTHVCLACDDVFATVETLRSKNYPIMIEPNVGADKNTQAWVTDPDGNRIEFMQIHPDSPQANA